MPILAVQNVGIGRAGDLLWLRRGSGREHDGSGWIPGVLNKPHWLSARNMSDAASVADEVSRMAKKIAVFAGAIATVYDAFIDVVPTRFSYVTKMRM